MVRLTSLAALLILLYGAYVLFENGRKPSIPPGLVDHPEGVHSIRTVPIFYGYGVGWDEESEGTAVNGSCFEGIHGKTAVVCDQHRLWKGSRERWWLSLPDHFGSTSNEPELLGK